MFSESINIKTMQKKLSETLKLIVRDIYCLLIIQTVDCYQSCFLCLFCIAIKPADGIDETGILLTVLIKNKLSKRYINRELAIKSILS